MTDRDADPGDPEPDPVDPPDHPLHDEPPGAEPAPVRRQADTAEPAPRATPPTETNDAEPNKDRAEQVRTSRSNRGAYVLIGLAVAGLLAVNVVRWVVDTGAEPASITDNTVEEFDPTRAIPRPSFTLTDVDGRPFEFSNQTSGQLTFLFFGYTSCPDICPIQMATLSAALADMPRVSSQIVFVTTDPSRDTPERLRTWLAGFDRPITGLTGTADELAAAQKAASVSAAIADEPDSQGRYNVGHAASVLIYTPDDILRASVPAGTTQAEWVTIIDDITGTA